MAFILIIGHLVGDASNPTPAILEAYSDLVREEEILDAVDRIEDIEYDLSEKLEVIAAGSAFAAARSFARVQAALLRFAEAVCEEHLGSVLTRAMPLE